jgi:hypothetical protein
MEPWNEALSEDWVSQPKSSPNPPTSSWNPISSQTSKGRKEPTSRLPQPKYLHRRAASGAKGNGSEIDGSIQIHGVDRGLVLKERPSSGNNAAGRRTAVSSVKSDQSNTAAISASRGRHMSRTMSTSTTQTTRYSTVQQKSFSSSPPKDRQRGLTPEWRRRLLGSERGYGETVDLFGPTGLENIFRPPTQPSEKSKPAKPRMIPPQLMPSSPPPYFSQPTYEASSDLVRDVEEEADLGAGSNGKGSDPAFSDRSDFNQVATSTWRGGRLPRNTIDHLFSHTTNLSFDSSGPASIQRSFRKSSRIMDRHSGPLQDHRLSDDSNASMSPIMISKHNTIHGIGYAALDLAESEALRKASSHGPPSRQVSESKSQTSTSTRDVSLGNFVTTRRGSYSKDGSFRRRPLSPSSMQSSRIGGHHHLQAHYSGNQIPLIRTRRKSTSSVASSMKNTPRSPPAVSIIAEGPPENASGSPMRLFDADYDTFTRERLYRRLSNIEDSMYPDRSDSFSIADEAANKHVHKDIQRHPRPHTRKPDENTNQHDFPLRSNSFGQGIFDEYQFHADSSYPSFLSEDMDEDSKDTRLVPLLTDDMRSVLRSFQVPEFAGSRKTSRSWHNSVGAQRTRSEAFSKSRASGEENHGSTTMAVLERGATIGSKRPSGSPDKVPTPKRRRTLPNDDRATSTRSESSQPIRDRHVQTQSVIGKRKDASYEVAKNVADPEVVAMRQILKPRNRSSISSTKDGQDLYQAALDLRLDKQLTIAKRQLASLGIKKEMIADSRKGSVTTQDYLDEATRVMELIRSRNRPRSGLTSEDVSEMKDGVTKNDSNQFEAIPEDNESTRESFSRPPSREGARSLPSKDQIQLDPRLLSHLDKYKENGTIGFITSSMELLTVGGNKHSTKKEEAYIESQPANIRIIPSNSDSLGEDNHTGGKRSIHSSSSDSCSGPATTKSVQTGSSERSDIRRNIPPHTVSHLIPGQVAGMIYDGAKQTWVKAKDAFPGSDCDEDPFGGIPDLSVNEMEELARIKRLSQSMSAEELKPVTATQEKALESQEDGRNGDDSNPGADPRPVTREALVHSAIDSSSVPSKLSKFASSGPQPETRATSWGDTIPRHPWKQGQTHPGIAGLLPLDQAAQLETVEDSIQSRIDVDDQNTEDSVIQHSDHAAVDSSPLTSRSHNRQTDHSVSDSHTNGDDSQIEEADSGFDHMAILDQSFINDQNQSRRLSFGLSPNSGYRAASRRVSFGGQSFTARPVSRIDEQSEGSATRMTEHCQRAGSAGFQVTVSTPLRLRDIPGTLSVPVSTIARRSQLSFHLSPLPDFTINQIDESFNRDIRHVAERRGVLCLRDIDSTFGLATEQLIKNVTDVEPYEPYWDWIRHIELKGKGLITLHDLDQFCSRIEKLDVSNNELGQLNGAPTSLRDLTISQNCLSNLTTWAHLTNLQFLDVSGNQLESLDGFAGLVHLRELRVDDNKLTSLDGIFDLDGLTMLKARRNLLQSIDFEGSCL